MLFCIAFASLDFSGLEPPVGAKGYQAATYKANWVKGRAPLQGEMSRPFDGRRLGSQERQHHLKSLEILASFCQKV
jgi:hypothetical protein